MVVAALSLGVGSAVQLRAANVHSLTAAHQPVAHALFTAYDPVPDPPHKILAPPLSPSPPPPPPAPPGPPAPARPAIVVNSTQQALINQDRAANGLGPLTWSNCLSGVARGQAAYLASGVPFQHYGGVQQDLGCHLGPQVGENIGWWSGGINDPQLNTMFMNSAEHRANILGPYRYVATAWAVGSDGHAFIAVEFG